MVAWGGPRGSAARLLHLALAAWLAASPAIAQSLPVRPPLPPVPGGAPAAAPVDPDAPPPYEPDLERLAERMGALAFLRDLCGDADAAAFRDRVAALLDAEAHSASRKGRLAAAFNRGVVGYAASYRTCTPSARFAIARGLTEVESLARDVQSRFGGS